jgi:hypothetical protein
VRRHRDARSWLPSMWGGCQEGGLERAECAPALVGVNVVRPVGRSTLTPRVRRRGMAPVEAAVFFALLGRRVASGWRVRVVACPKSR